MKKNKGFYEINYSNYEYDDLHQNNIITKVKDSKFAFFINDKKLFFKEEENFYNEIIASKIGEVLNIKHVDYKLANVLIKHNNSLYDIKGVIAKDYRIENHNIISLNKIINEYNKYLNEEIDTINLTHIWQALEYRYQNYKNKDIIINDLIDTLVTYYMCDILIGNFDHGLYNYEIMEDDLYACFCPYYDNGYAFLFNKSPRFNVDNDNYSFYDALRDFLYVSDNTYITKFIDMYNTLTCDKFEEIISEVQVEHDILIDENYKNILLLSYYKHYEKMGKILNNYQKKRR